MIHTGEIYTAKWDARQLDGIIEPKVGYPIVTLRDHFNNIVSQLNAKRSGQYEWRVDFYIPDMQLDTTVPFTVTWDIIDVEDEPRKVIETVYVLQTTPVEFGDVVLLYTDLDVTYAAPDVFVAKQIKKIEIFSDNEVVQTILPTDFFNGEPVITTDTHHDYTLLTFTLPNNLPPKLDEYMVVLHIERQKRILQMNFSMWVVTPSMLKLTQTVEANVNKARLSNQIDSLQWHTPDLLLAMKAGLAKFNSILPLTSFTGQNMKGVLFQALVLCTEYYALRNQLKAEGDLAFSQSGQSTTFETRRAEAIEALIGRVEGEINDKLPPLKDNMAKYGIVSGDGRNGDLANLSQRHLGFVQLSDSPLTKLTRGSLGHVRGRRPFM